MVAEEKNQQPMDRIRRLQKMFPQGSHLELTSYLLPPRYVWWIDMPVLVVACLLWHDTAWCDAPDVLRNLAMDFSTIELLASPAIPSFAVAIHMDWKHTWSHAFLQCPYLHSSLVMIRHCLCWTSSVVGLRFFICLLLLCKLLLCSHSVNLAPSAGIFKLALKCCQIEPISEPNKIKYRTKPPGLSISHPRKRKRQQFYYKSFGSMLPAQLSCWCLGNLVWCPSILDAAIHYRGMACGWFLLIFCSPRLAKSSLPFRGSAYVKGKQHDKRHAVEGTPTSYCTLLKPWVLPSRLEQSNTFLILKLYCS